MSRLVQIAREEQALAAAGFEPGVEAGAAQTGPDALHALRAVDVRMQFDRQGADGLEVDEAEEIVLAAFDVEDEEGRPDARDGVVEAAARDRDGARRFAATDRGGGPEIALDVERLLAFGLAEERDVEVRRDAVQGEGFADARLQRGIGFEGVDALGADATGAPRGDEAETGAQLHDGVGRREMAADALEFAPLVVAGVDGFDERRGEVWADGEAHARMADDGRAPEAAPAQERFPAEQDEAMFQRHGWVGRVAALSAWRGTLSA